MLFSDLYERMYVRVLVSSRCLIPLTDLVRVSEKSSLNRADAHKGRELFLVEEQDTMFNDFNILTETFVPTASFSLDFPTKPC